MRIRFRWIAGVLLLLSVAAPAAAQRIRTRPELTPAGIQRRTLTRDRQEIERWYDRYHQSAVRDMPRREPLPPGVVEQLVRGEELPRGLEGEIHPLPRDLEVRLSALDVSLKRGYIDGRVITWNRKSRRIVDVIELPPQRSG